MELIPILSLIVLMATISTFILAVGAYVMYKVREKRGRMAKAMQPVSIEAELVTPAPLLSQRKTTGYRPSVTEEQQEEAAPVPTMDRQATGSPYMGRQTQPAPVTEQRFPQSVTNEIPERKLTGGKSKYMRYTSEGYVEPSPEKPKKEVKLKWR